jgi:hypothetical protein
MKYTVLTTNVNIVNQPGNNVPVEIQGSVDVNINSGSSINIETNSPIEVEAPNAQTLSLQSDYGQQGIIVQPCTSLTNSTTYTSASPAPTLSLNSQYWNPPILSATFTPNPNTIHYRWGYFFPQGLDITQYQSFRLFLWCMSSNSATYGNTFVVFRDWYGNEAYIQLSLTNSANTYQFNLSNMTNLNTIQQALVQYILIDFDTNSSSQIQQTFVTRNWMFLGGVGQMQDPTFGIQHSLNASQTALFVTENTFTGSYLSQINSFSTGTVGNYLQTTVTIPPGGYIRIKNLLIALYDTSLYYYSLSDDITQLNNLTAFLWNSGSPIPANSTTVLSLPPVTAILQNATTSAENYTTSQECWMLSVNLNRSVYNNTNSNMTIYYKIAVATARTATDNGIKMIFDFDGGNASWFSPSYQNTGGSGNTNGSGGSGGGTGKKYY